MSLPRCLFLFFSLVFLLAVSQREQMMNNNNVFLSVIKAVTRPEIQTENFAISLYLAQTGPQLIITFSFSFFLRISMPVYQLIQK